MACISLDALPLFYSLINSAPRKRGANDMTYTITAWSRTQSHGTPNAIIASAATRKGVMAEYARHLARFAAARLDPKYAAVNMYKNGALVERLM